MSQTTEEKESSAAIVSNENNQKKRKTPDDPRVKVAEFQEAMDSVLETTLRLMEEHDIPDDWVEFDPCDENGGMLWSWHRPKGRYRLWVFADSNQATVDDGDGLELVSVSKAVRRLKRMMDDDEEEDDD